MRRAEATVDIPFCSKNNNKIDIGGYAYLWLPENYNHSDANHLIISAHGGAIESLAVGGVNTVDGYKPKRFIVPFGLTIVFYCQHHQSVDGGALEGICTDHGLVKYVDMVHGGNTCFDYELEKSKNAFLRRDNAPSYSQQIMDAINLRASNIQLRIDRYERNRERKLSRINKQRAAINITKSEIDSLISRISEFDRSLKHKKNDAPCLISREKNKLETIKQKFEIRLEKEKKNYDLYRKDYMAGEELIVYYKKEINEQCSILTLRKKRHGGPRISLSQLLFMLRSMGYNYKNVHAYICRNSADNNVNKPAINVQYHFIEDLL